MASAEVQTLKVENQALKQELYQEMLAGNALRAELARSWQLSYSAFGVALATGLAAAFLAAKLHRPQ